jgi:hypothetical protein
MKFLSFSKLLNGSVCLHVKCQCENQDNVSGQSDLASTMETEHGAANLPYNHNERLTFPPLTQHSHHTHPQSERNPSSVCLVLCPLRETGEKQDKGARNDK